jgi:hypothetical protein
MELRIEEVEKYKDSHERENCVKVAFCFGEEPVPN